MRPRPRSIRRAIPGGRDASRAFAVYNGPAPRYEPVLNDTCPAHHRKFPCKRCTGVG